MKNIGKIIVAVVILGVIIGVIALALKLVTGLVSGAINLVLGIGVVAALGIIVAWMFWYAAKNR